MSAIVVERLLTWTNRTPIGVAHHMTTLIFYNISRCYGKHVAVFAVAVATGDIIKYQSFVYGSFVWGIHVRYNKSFYQLPLILTAEFHIYLIKDVYLTAILSLSGLHMRGSRNFCQGGVQAWLWKQLWQHFFFSPQLTLQFYRGCPMVISKKL